MVLTNIKIHEFDAAAAILEHEPPHQPECTVQSQSCQLSSDSFRRIIMTIKRVKQIFDFPPNTPLAPANGKKYTPEVR